MANSTLNGNFWWVIQLFRLGHWKYSDVAVDQRVDVGRSSLRSDEVGEEGAMTGEQWPAHIPWGQQKDMVFTHGFHPWKTHGKTHENHGKNPWTPMEKKPISFTGRSHGLSISFSDVGAAELGRKALQLVCRQRDSANLWEFLDLQREIHFSRMIFRSYRFYLEENFTFYSAQFSVMVFFYPLPAFFSMVIHGFFFIPSVLPIIIIPMWNPRLPRLPGGHPDFPYGGFPKLGGTPQKKHSFLDWEFPINNRTLLGSPFFQPFEAQVWRRFSGRTWLLLLLGEQVAGRCPKNGGLSPQFFCGLNGIEIGDYFRIFFGSRQVGELWINSPRFMGKWDRKPTRMGGWTPSEDGSWLGFTSLWPWLQPPLYSMFFFFFFKWGHTANTANKIYSLRSFAGWFTLW